MNVLVFGGSRNIGYYASLRLLNQGATVTFLLRSTGVFDSDQDMKPFITQGKAMLVEGDALKPDDVKAAWDKALTANDSHTVDFVLFTVGGSPSYSLTQGFVINPPNLCTQSILNVLCAMPDLPVPPKFIVVTAMGITAEGHTHLPLPLKPLYSYFLASPHADKLGVERVLAYCSGKEWTDAEPNSKIMSGPLGSWSDRSGLPAKGALKDIIVIIRPALFTDGQCKGDSGEDAYRASEQYFSSAYRVSRKDVAHFISTKVIRDWSEWKGKAVQIAY